MSCDRQHASCTASRLSVLLLVLWSEEVVVEAEGGGGSLARRSWWRSQRVPVTHSASSDTHASSSSPEAHSAGRAQTERHCRGGEGARDGARREGEEQGRKGAKAGEREMRGMSQ
eukprot:1811064-Rhodomonas_salina.2